MSQATRPGKKAKGNDGGAIDRSENCATAASPSFAVGSDLKPSEEPSNRSPISSRTRSKGKSPINEKKPGPRKVRSNEAVHLFFGFYLSLVLY